MMAQSKRVEQTQETDSNAWIRQIQYLNLVYAGVVGAVFLFGTSTASLVSFFAGWIVAAVNFELLRRIGILLIALAREGAINPLLYGLLVGKFAFWGMLIALLSLTTWIQGVPFMVGTATLLFSSVGLGVSLIFKEFGYARRT